jgi:crotonobetaine/carnitine-CoA ligase
MTNFITKRPSGPEDRDHPLKKVIIAPLSEDAPAFAARFGVETYTLYNMTEISTPLVSELNPTKIGSCGKARKGVELRLVDEHDCEVATGDVGELLVRTDAPWALNSGYYKNPEATAAAWRNGWFHTGDAFRRDEQGRYYFVDRFKDALRRRGENISSFEVEALVNAHPGVLESAVIPVPSEWGEDEIKVCVVRSDVTLTEEQLVRDLVATMPRFMIPRYVELVESLPKTEAMQRVKKVLLRDDPLNERTWDREAAGVDIPR